MQSRASVFGLSLVLCFSFFFMCPSAVGQDAEGNNTGVVPNLRSLRNEARHEVASRDPQYVVVDLSLKKILEYYPELKGLVPAQSQQELPNLLERVGANQKLLLNLPSICGDENVVQQEVDKHGWAVGPPAFTGHFNYLVRAHVPGEGVRFSEGRTDEHWRAIDPPLTSGYSLIQGFALLPMHFHPYHQEAGHFRYLGRHTLNNREYHVVAFAQQPDKAELLGGVRVNGADITVAYQGVAWIDPENFQIARMRTDLLMAKPGVGMEMTETQFTEVHLPVVAKSFWLPNEAVVTRRTKNGTLREKHQFSDYKIFVK